MARISAAQKNRELTQRNRYPDLTLGVSPSQVGSRITTWGVMLEMNIPLQQESRRSQEREPPAKLPTLGKGQRPHALAAAGYDTTGRPRAVSAAPAASAVAQATTLVTSMNELSAAVAAALPGQVVELAPGSYALQQTLTTGHAGLASQPIVVRAAKPGSVEIVVTAVQAVVVNQPYWVFENLNWRGACLQHDECDHALHVVGQARGTVILNNRISDFNAPLKINGQDGAWPDDGLLQFSTLTNSAPRRTWAISLSLIPAARHMSIHSPTAPRRKKARIAPGWAGCC